MHTLLPLRQPCSHSIRRCLISNTIHSRNHKKPYPGTKNVYKTPVSAEQASWDVNWPDYKPKEYTADKVLKCPSWADNPDVNKIQNFNRTDGKLNRKSYIGEYDFDKQTNRPLNPLGRTGLTGRGLLGRWGPNHASDPLITRWSQRQEKVLEIVLINRQDSGSLAFPGGMVDPSEDTLQTAKREFIEEALNSNPNEAKKLDKLFKNQTSIYKGYIDDSRNTDNAWIESDAINVHDENGQLTKDLKLESGDDASKVQWIELDRDHNLHGSHEDIVRILIKKHGAYEYWHDK